MILNKNTDLKQIRSDIKKMGFNYRLKKYSDFTFIQFFHIETKKDYPDLFTKDSLIFWEDLITYLKGK